jgi:hypothetical protein
MDESEWDKVLLLALPPCHTQLTPSQCWAANVKAPHALLKAAKPTFEKNAEGGVMITTGSIAVRIPSCSLQYVLVSWMLEIE